MKNIFLSYRREDSSDISGRIYDWLRRRLPKEYLFKDVYSIDGGVNFVQKIDAAIRRCQIFLVIIGPKWLCSENIQKEIEFAFQYKRKIIPVLVNGAVMPAADGLPPSVAQFAYLNSVNVRQDPDFPEDMAKLGKLLGVQSSLLLPFGLRPLYPWLTVFSMLGLVGAVLLTAEFVFGAFADNFRAEQLFTLLALLALMAGPAAVFALIQVVRRRHFLWGIALLVVFGFALLRFVRSAQISGDLSIPLDAYLFAGSFLLLSGALTLYGFMGQTKRAAIVAIPVMVVLIVGGGLYYYLGFQPNHTVGDISTDAVVDGANLQITWGSPAKGDASYLEPSTYLIEIITCAPSGDCASAVNDTTCSYHRYSMQIAANLSGTTQDTAHACGSGASSIQFTMQGRSLGDGHTGYLVSLPLPPGCYTWSLEAQTNDYLDSNKQVAGTVQCIT
jgi:hypothetical protein